MSRFRQLKQSLVDMEDFLNVLKVRPAAEDGTKELNVFQKTPEHYSNGSGHHLHGSHNVKGSNGARVPGLSIEFSKVKFGYTDERPVRSDSELPTVPLPGCLCFSAALMDDSSQSSNKEAMHIYLLIACDYFCGRRI